MKFIPHLQSSKHSQARKGFLLSVALCVVVASGCAKSSATTSNVNKCVSTHEHTCTEWTGLNFTELKDVMLTCTGDGKFSAGPCPREGAIGTCKLAKEKMTMVHYKGELKMTDLKEMCAGEKGEFSL